MGNEHPSMGTWQVDTFATWEVLAEIIVASGVSNKIRWDEVVKRAEARCGEDQQEFVRVTIDGIRRAVSTAESSGRS